MDDDDGADDEDKRFDRVKKGDFFEIVNMFFGGESFSIAKLH